MWEEEYSTGSCSPPACGQLGLLWQSAKGRWLTNSRRFFLAVLSAGSPRSGKRLGRVLPRALFWGSNCWPLPVSSPGGGPRGSKLTQDSRRALLPFVRALLKSPPLSLTASQRCHLLGVRVQLMDLGGHKPSVHNCLRYQSLLLWGDGKSLATLS